MEPSLKIYTLLINIKWLVSYAICEYITNPTKIKNQNLFPSSSSS